MNYFEIINNGLMNNILKLISRILGKDIYFFCINSNGLNNIVLD